MRAKRRRPSAEDRSAKRHAFAVRVAGQRGMLHPRHWPKRKRLAGSALKRAIEDYEAIVMQIGQSRVEQDRSERLLRQATAPRLRWPRRGGRRLLGGGGPFVDQMGLRLR